MHYATDKLGLCGVARTDEFYVDPMFICPDIQGFAGELWAIVHMQQERQLPLLTQSFKNRDCSIIDLQSGTASIPQIHDGHTLKRRPLVSWSLMKSSSHFWFGPVRTDETVRSLLSFFFFFLLRRESCSSR